MSAGLTLIAVETDVNHVHVFVSAPPRWSPAQIANLLKGYTSRYLRELKRACGRDQLWTQAYYVGTAGAGIGGNHPPHSSQSPEGDGNSRSHC